MAHSQYSVWYHDWPVAEGLMLWSKVLETSITVVGHNDTHFFVMIGDGPTFGVPKETFVSLMDANECLVLGPAQ